MEKSYRIHTNIIKDTLLNVNMKQDFDFLEVLSLKLRQKDAYRLHSSNYGVIIGRVLANDAFGIPNAKVSVFIERDENDPVDMENVYPFSETTTRNKKGVKYNLLPDYSDDDCYRVVGTFPQKRYLLDDNIQLEVYDKYYKYSTVTSNAGDYMIFGVPAGSQTVHIDIDLSDIGILSQKPRDFTYRGYDLSEFDSPSQFKASTNYDSLRQIFSQDKSVYVYPFWGDAENGIAAITRCDVQIAYKFEPTCVFMGSIVSDNEGNSIGHKCAPNEENGMNAQLIAGEGTIEMIRKTPDGFVEEYPIQGNALIDSDGVWCYQIPMNLDYVGTDEYGNIVPTDNPATGIPTRTQVRFRISKTETGNEGVSKHTAKYLVPMNPVLFEGPAENGKNPEIPMTQEESGEEIDKMYNFGSNTPQSCFRDLYWNNVYSVKNFIPKTQVAHRPYAPNYSALKGSNLVEDQNPIPFNKLRIDLPFLYIIVCIIFRIIIIIVTVINTIICGVNVILGIIKWMKDNLCFLGWCPLDDLLDFIPDAIACIPLSAGLEEGNIAYYPGCDCNDGLEEGSCPQGMEDGCERQGGYDSTELKDKIERNLAREFKIVKLDFYQDWINGVLYMPLWYWRKRRKKSYLFGLIVRRAKNEFCSCDEEYTRHKTYVTCEIEYNGNSLQTDDNSVDYDENRWHKKRTSKIWFRNGLIKNVENKDGLTVYYYAAFNANTSDKREISTPLKMRFNRFYMVRLYATDIILLGNLNEDNYYGIPQLYKGLPSTTANIPLIATVEEDTKPNSDKEEIPDNDTSESRDEGTVITTGMDWGHEGADQTPMYGNGLFMNLSCTYVDTKAKACINVERLSELGVSLDMTYNMPYPTGQGIKYGTINTDGFISKYELDDMETRAMFATLNHIGFIPQDYQDKIGAYTTQVRDEHTGYLIPKFKYIYPVDFDGRMHPIMENYTDNFDQASFDEADEAYITFRLGAESGLTYDKDNKPENEDGRIRHFYFADTRDYKMPLYNNSFYFYFGINKGSTAIDKFNKLFYAPCFQNDRKPFTFDYTSKGKSYCPSTYSGGEVKDYYGYGYIDVKLDDIQKPYSYSLYDDTGMEIISESDMNMDRFIIGGYIDERDGSVKSNPEGMVYYQVGPNSGTPVHNMYGDGGEDTSGLTNQTYTLTIKDINGRSISEKIELSIPNIIIEYETQQLGTKFYTTASTRIDYICTDETQLYGRLKLTDFVVDGYMYNITGSSAMMYDPDTQSYVVQLSGETDDINGVEGGNTKLKAYAVVRLGISNSSEENYVRECLCDSTNRTASIQRAAANMFIQAATAAPTPTSYWFASNNASADKNTFFVYQPNDFTLTITQLCGGKELEENTTSEIVAVNNGQNFNAFVSDMPVKFMIGSITDGLKKDEGVGVTTSELVIANQSNFYRSAVVRCANGDGIKGWYGLHQETAYMFDKIPDLATIMRNTAMWSDFVDMKSPISSFKSKSNILKYKFDTMFSLSRSGYITGDNKPLTYTALGGGNFILYRSVMPHYESKDFKNRYILSEKNRATCRNEYPHIVGTNYSGYTHIDEQKPYFNLMYYDNNADCSNRGNAIGNYFAAFNKNGGYTSSTSIDSSIKIMKIPNFTKVTPRTGTEKIIGRDEIAGLGNFQYSFEKRDKYQPYLRTLFIDRRFDFDLTIFAPLMGNSINLYPQTVEKEGGQPVCKKYDEVTGECLYYSILSDEREKIWKSARVSGWTFNGVEMSYDREYNIISADITYRYFLPVKEGTATVEKEFNSTEDAINYMYLYYGGDPSQIDEEKMARAEDYVNDNIRLDEVVAKPNRRLEYSYNFSNNEPEDAATVYNEPSADSTIWEYEAYDQYKLDENGEIVYENDEPVIEVLADTDTRHQILKRYYEASFGDFDIRDYFWSKFNEKKLETFTHQSGYTIVSATPFIFSHPRQDMRSNANNNSFGYNDDFNMENVYNNGNGGNYPTVRAIDICNIAPSNVYSFNVLPCSYRMKSRRNNNYTITCKAGEGDGLEFESTFDNPIIFIPPNDDSNDYCNVEYKYIGDKDGDYCVFTARTANLYFKYNPVSNNGFDVYTSVPRVVRVLPYFEGKPIKDENGVMKPMKYDGISYIKTTTPNGEIACSDSVDKLLKPENSGDRSKGVVLHYFRRPSSAYFFFLSYERDMTLPAGVVLDDHMRYKSSNDIIDNSYFFYNEDTGKYVTSDCNDFENIKFKKENISLEIDGEKGGKVKVLAFTIVVDRRYLYKRNDMLKRRLRTIEFGDIVDCRKILLRINQGTNDKGDPNTYLQCIYAGSTSVKVKEVSNNKAKGDVNPDTGEVTVNVQTSEKEKPVDNKMYIQVITFDMLMHLGAEPESAESQVFADYSMMGYTFRFKNKNGDEYDIEPTNITEKIVGDNKVISFTVRWQSGMGVLADGTGGNRSCNGPWGNETKCTIFAKTIQSGLIYKLANFGINLIEQEGDYNSDCKKTSSMSDGEKKLTKAQITTNNA